MASETSWRKASYSGAQGGNCTEVAAVPGAVLIRDSKDSGGPKLSVAPAAWKAFTDRLKSRLYGEHQLKNNPVMPLAS